MTYDTPYTAKSVREWHDDLISTDERTQYHALEAWKSHDYMPLKWALDTIEKQAAELEALRNYYNGNRTGQKRLQALLPSTTHAGKSRVDAAADEIEALRERCEYLEVVAHDAQAVLQFVTAGTGKRLIGPLLHLVRMASGDDGPEYAKALELIGAPPADDASAPDCPKCGIPLGGDGNDTCNEHGTQALPFASAAKSEHAPVDLPTVDQMLHGANRAELGGDDD